MALILPHTDLEGAYAIAERVRAAIEELRIRGSTATACSTSPRASGLARRRRGTGRS